ncbi:NAD-dependent epimerase/dehydratase family protein [Candidatus Nitrosotalea okcheonensis]|uniref:Putative UDP-glucose 4-epimerase n=1 Tax=Candidatus Nitrosotalea okcheonensis TaxID=1903276 RepID=A0A2H1FHW3_9ARCH|nr:NAD-dependent epimerase/dehydratase family protein [Candidatus Nitrosotalea okcheonensis]SMH72282.1 putative UDP-glucose 4-epimerase [Candidatus Nitrosotalea okcheonensis]
MKFIITGGAGFIGSHLAEFLSSKGHSVQIIDNLSSGKLANLSKVLDQIDFLKFDILNYDKLREAVKDIDGIFHHAALTSVQDSFLRPEEYERVNVQGTENILRAAKEFEIKVVFASSASVYGNPEKIPIKEDAERRPLNPYGLSKLKAENLCAQYYELGVSVIGLRYFNVYGPRQTKDYAGVITKFIDNALDKKPLLINGNGFQVRDFVSVNDVAAANFLAMKSNVTCGFINIGSGIATSIKELAEMIMQLSGMQSEPIYEEFKEGDIRFSQANVDLAKELLDWKPKTILKDWLKENVKNL